MWTVIVLLIFVTMAPTVHLQSNLDEIILRCQNESQSFTENEDQYADKKSHDPTKEADPAGPQTKELQEMTYSIQIRQRPFECISNNTDKYSKQQIEMNPKYQALARECRMEQSEPHCNSSSRYRSMDGTCNNPMYPKWGSIFSCFRRLLTPSFEGVSGFRQSVCKQPLPNPRTVSLTIHQDRTRPTKDITHMSTLFGQFVAHDLTDTSLSYIGIQPIDCCSHPTVNQHPQCAPILLSKNDPFYSQFGLRCINLVRAAICDTCETGKRNQMNQATAYIDLNLIYGAIENLTRPLRTYDGTGKMKSNYINDEELLSPDFSQPVCGNRKKRQLCFNSGDHRINQHSIIMSLHTLFHREHNRIAKIMKQMNPHWDEETLFQEARKVNIAQVQAIIYGEYLPLIIGPNLMQQNYLRISGQNGANYDSSVDATLFAEFAAAAFRLHSTLKGDVSQFYLQPGKRLLRFQFQNSVPLYSGSMSSLMKGISLSPAEKYDRFVTSDMTDFLNRAPNGTFGFDIASFNIQRGRDFGLPRYTEMVSFLSQGSTNIQRFEDLECCMEKENIEALRRIYCDVKDIDLWVGLNNEKFEKDMVVGPSAGKIIAAQFSNLKKGDQFYFEYPGNFNDEQLETLKYSSLSRVMCANLKIQGIQRDAFQYSSNKNPFTLCKDISKLNLNFWRD